jgi:UTP--glucose-1-phosphate uridylyltransferase
LQQESVLGYTFDGIRYDCGSKLGYLQANVMYGMKHAEVGVEFARFLAQVAGKAPK